MNWRLSPTEQFEAIKYACIALSMVLTYIFLWRRQRPLAVIILLGFSVYIIVNTVDFQYWRQYLFVDWGSGGLTN